MCENFIDININYCASSVNIGPSEDYFSNKLNGLELFGGQHMTVKVSHSLLTTNAQVREFSMEKRDCRYLDETEVKLQYILRIMIKRSLFYYVTTHIFWAFSWESGEKGENEKNPFLGLLAKCKVTYVSEK